MPPKEKSQKKGSGGKNKRKVISPLSSDTTLASDNTAKTGLDSARVTGDHSDIVGETVSNQNKRFHPSSPEYFVFNHAAMNYSQQPYPGQMLQSPQGQYAPPYMTTPTAQTAQVTPPPWAISLLEDVKNIKLKVDKIESVEKTVNIINAKLTQLETKVDNIDKRVVDVEKNCSFVSEQYDDQSRKLKSAETEIKQMHESCSNLKRSMESLERDRDRLNDKVLEGEFRSMRDNLIFYGISEPTAEDRQEDCDIKVKAFINEHLKIDAQKMVFDRAHRLGATRGNTTPRPIIVKFHYFNERETVRKTAYPLRDELRVKKKGVGVQLPKEWRESRKSLSTVFQEEKRKGNNVKFVGEKLLINGRQYKSPSTATA